MGYDTVAAFVVTLHQMFGHDKACRYIGGEDLPRDECHLCHPELGPIDWGDGDVRDEFGRQVQPTEQSRDE
jgi:hypothetical protein